MNRFQAVQQAILGAVGELLGRHPSLLDGLSDDDARALGREAADRAFRAILADHVPHVTPESHERHLTSPVSRSTGEKVSAHPENSTSPLEAT